MKVLAQIQQGDVWIEKVSDLSGHTLRENPTMANNWSSTIILSEGRAMGIVGELRSKIAEKNHTIALGEATGHHHQLVAEKEAIVVDMDKGIFELMEQAILTHEEHKPISLEPGLYRFGIINEYDYDSKFLKLDEIQKEINEKDEDPEYMLDGPSGLENIINDLQYFNYKMFYDDQMNEFDRIMDDLYDFADYHFVWINTFDRNADGIGKP